MKTLEIDILLYHPERPQETRVTVRIPVAQDKADKLLRGVMCYDQNALYNLAGAVGYLNGVRGIPLRVREVAG